MRSVRKEKTDFDGPGSFRITGTPGARAVDPHKTGKNKPKKAPPENFWRPSRIG